MPGTVIGDRDKSIKNKYSSFESPQYTEGEVINQIVTQTNIKLQLGPEPATQFAGGCTTNENAGSLVQILRISR